jgi:hypothetical protein
MNGIIDSNQKIVANGLVTNLDAAQLRSYPGSGSTWTDLSGTSNNVTLINGPTFDSANGGSILFDGVDDYGQLVTFNSNANFTFSVFLKYTVSTIGSGLAIIAGYATPPFHADRFELRIYDGSLQIVQSYRALIGTFANSGVLINTIYNISIVRTGNTYDCYINGVYKSSLTSTLTFLTTQIAIGQNSTLEFYKGNMYNIIQYNRALTATEITQNYNATKSRFGL